MKIKELLQKGREQLNESTCTESVDLDSSLLLAHTLKISREKLYTLFHDTVSEDLSATFLELIEMRTHSYPVAYIMGEKEFFGRPFTVKEGVLCPRPDTEIIIEKALELIDTSFTNLLDLCSGSGCIGITMALETSCHVECADIDQHPQEAFETNRKQLKAEKASFIRSDLFENINGTYQMILTNPPYLTRQETDERMQEGWKEPALALDGGEDGLDLIRKIIHQSIDYLSTGGYLLIEAAPEQMSEMGRLMKLRGFSSIGTVHDLAGSERVIYGQWNKQRSNTLPG